MPGLLFYLRITALYDKYQMCYQEKHTISYNRNANRHALCPHDAAYSRR